jgi:Flp pilus assembly protein TadB
MNTALPADLAAVALVLLLGGRTSTALRRPILAERRPQPNGRSTPGRWAIGGVLGIVVVAVAGPLAALVVITAATVVGWWRVRRRRLRRATAMRNAYPDAIDLVVLAIRAGLLPAAAIAATADHVDGLLRPAFIEVGERAARGDRLADALTALTDHLGATAAALVDSLASAERYGLPIAPVLERLADEARSDRRRAADAAARQLPVRLAAPLVVCTLPAFVLLAIVPLLIGAFSSWHVP